MPFVLIIAGIVLLIAAIRNSQGDLFHLLAGDFTGPNNFIFWFVSILIIGAIGYIPKLKPVSDGFLILVILVLFLRRGSGFFDMFQKQINTTQASVPPAPGSGTGNANKTGTGISFGPL